MPETMKTIEKGKNVIIGKNVSIGENVTLMHNCIVEDGVSIGDDSYIDNNTIIRRGTKLGSNSFIGANCILGEYQMDFCKDRTLHKHKLIIGDHALIRSNSIIYTGSTIGDEFQTGHHVTVRERTKIGHHVSLGTLSDIQGQCCIGDYVRAHSKVFVGELTIIDSFVWIFPYVVFTNDPTPPSEELAGVHVHSFAVVAAGAIILPGKEIGQDSLVGAGSVVTRDVAPFSVVAGNPAKPISDVRRIKNKKTGKPVYPWRDYFQRAMPWEESTFQEWYDSIDIKKRQYYHLEHLE